MGRRPSRRGGEPGPRGRAEEPRADSCRPAACSGLAEGACRPPAEAKRVQETGGAVEGALGVAGGRGSRLSPGSWSHLCCAVRRMILAVLPLNSEAENAFLASVRPNRICEGRAYQHRVLLHGGLRQEPSCPQGPVSPRKTKIGKTPAFASEPSRGVEAALPTQLLPLL